MPYAVVGSNTVLEVKGKKVRGRAYPWGVVEGKLVRFYFSTWSVNKNARRLKKSCSLNIKAMIL